jgi:tetratricopeptide (TPR) repeat protein
VETVASAPGRRLKSPALWLPCGVFALAAGLRLLLFSSLRGAGPIEDFFGGGPVFSKYPWLAAKIAAGAPLGDRLLDFSPLYTFLMTQLAALFADSRVAGGLLQILLGSLCCVLLYQVAATVAGRAAGAIAGAIAAVYAPFLLYECVFEPEVLIIFLNLLSLVLLLGCREQSRSAWWLLPGATLGLSFVTRPNLLVLLACVLLWLLLTFRESPRRLAQVLAWLGAGLCLTIAPVLVRNYRLSGSVLAPLMSSGQVLYQGNNPTAKGFYGSHPYLLKEMEADPAINRESEPDFAHELYRLFAGKPLAAAPAAAGASSGAVGADTESFWYRRAAAFAGLHPAAFARLLGEKFRAFWSSYEIHDVLPLYYLEWEMQRLPLLTFGAVVPFAVLGLVLAAGDFRRHLLLYGFAFNYLFSNLMFFVSSRQRLLALPFLIVFAAIAVARGGGALRSAALSLRFPGAPWPRRARPLLGVGAGALALLGLALAVNRPAAQLEHFATLLHLNRDSKRHLAQGRAALSAGDPAGARGHFQAAFDLLPLHPTRVANRYLGGDGRKYAAATRFWEGVLSRKSDNAYAHLMLGELSLLSGDADRALRELGPLADAGEEFFLGYLVPIAQPRYLVARALELRGDLAGAGAEYERLERERPGLPWVAARRIVLAQIAGDEVAAGRLRAALERLDNPISSAYLLGEAYRDRGLYDAAIRTLESAPRQLLERYAPYHFLLGECYAGAAAVAAPAGADALFDAAIRECRAGLKLGTNLNRLGPAVAAAYRRALSRDPGNRQLSYELGVVCLSRGDLASARENLTAALAPGPGALSDAAGRSIRATLEEIAALERVVRAPGA